MFNSARIHTSREQQETSPRSHSGNPCFVKTDRGPSQQPGVLGLIRMGAFHELFKSDACFHESVTAPAVKYTVNDQEERIMGHETIHAFVHADYTQS